MAECISETKIQSTSCLKQKITLYVSTKDLIGHCGSSTLSVQVKDKHTGELIGRRWIGIDSYIYSYEPICFDFFFENEQALKFNVCEIYRDPKDYSVFGHLLGSCVMKLRAIVDSPDMTMASNLMHRGQKLVNEKTGICSSLIVKVENVSLAENVEIIMQLRANNLPKLNGIFGKVNPYFLLQTTREDGKCITVYGNRDNHIKKTLNPRWKPFKIESQRLCYNDPNRPITISVYNYNRDGNDNCIGKIETTLNELRSAPKKLDLVRSSDKDGTTKRKSGNLSVLSFSSKPEDSFFHYIRENVGIKLIRPKNLTSDVALFTDKIWHGLGSTTAHKYNLKSNQGDSEKFSIHGIERCHLNGIRNHIFALSGPTLFQPILRKAHILAKNAHAEYIQNKNNSKQLINYLLLFIVTDGIINDMKPTKDEIVAIANDYLPLSVIIVGVGNGDFKAMDELNADYNGLMNSKGVYAQRDIIQFVPMNKRRSTLSILSTISTQFASYARSLPLGKGWYRARDQNGRAFYVNHLNHKTQFEHPLLSNFKTARCKNGPERALDGDKDAVVYIWRFEGTKGNWGHASLSIPGDYISWWPKYGVTFMTKKRNVEAEPNNLVEDIESEGREPDHQIEVKKVNVGAISVWWNDYKYNNEYCATSTNCAKVVLEALKVGGLDLDTCKKSKKKMKKNIVPVTPQTVLNLLTQMA